MAVTAMDVAGMPMAVMGVVVTDAVTARALISEIPISTVTVHSGPGSPIPAIIGHGHRVRVAATPNS
jgi:hypothetical protein